MYADLCRTYIYIPHQTTIQSGKSYDKIQKVKKKIREREKDMKECD